MICAEGAAQPTMSSYPNVRFLTSASAPQQLLPDTGSEVAFAGRSNAGKSSAINAITVRNALARVSRTPGRTQLINFFELADDRRLVDLPGYGFAKVPQSVRQNWLAFMQHYFNVRESLKGLMLIVDSRRGLGAEDVAMLEWILARGKRAHVLLTKADKLKRNESVQVLRDTAAACEDAQVSVQLFSAHARTGIETAQTVMDEWLQMATVSKR
jgi:GTP-binding protein